jgi:predicted Zn-dependent protease
MLDPTLMQSALSMLAALPSAAPHARAPKRLKALFAKLLDPAAIDPHETEDLIWAIWCDAADAHAAEQMGQAIAAIAARKFDLAEPVLDRMVAAWPTWAEAWNKRATLFYVQGRDAEAVADIILTLQLEPRHFGALAGLGQIFLRHDEPEAAAAAFRAALVRNPHLPGVEAMLNQIESSLPRAN